MKKIPSDPRDEDVLQSNPKNINRQAVIRRVFKGKHIVAKESTTVSASTIPAWRETPLDHWSRDIDPAIMAGDEWTGKGTAEDPGAQRINSLQGLTRMRETFMHPTHDSNYELEDDAFGDSRNRSEE